MKVDRSYVTCVFSAVTCLSEGLYSFGELFLLRKSLSLGEEDGVRASLVIISHARHDAAGVPVASQLQVVCTLPGNARDHARSRYKYNY